MPENVKKKRGEYRGKYCPGEAARGLKPLQLRPYSRSAFKSMRSKSMPQRRPSLSITGI